MQALRVRLQDLEFVLEQAHGLVAHDTHFPLEDEFSKTTQDSRDVVRPVPGRSPTTSPEDAPVADFGTMKISKSGSSRWLEVG
jgi:hypothetical protein